MTKRKATKKWKATHTVPPGGLQTYVNNQPSTSLDPGLEIQVAETSGLWARVVASNGWECWVEASALVQIPPAVAPAAAVAGPPLGPPQGPPAGPTVSAQVPPAQVPPAAVPPPVAPPPAGQPPAPAAAAYSAAQSPRKRGGPPWIPILIGVIILLLVIGGASGGYLLLNASAADVSLEQAGAQSAQPFNPDVTASTDTSPSPSASASASPAASPQAAPKGPDGVAIYGGSGNNHVCNKQKLIDFLTSHSSEGAAWAAVEGISTSQISSFIGELTPQILSQDVRVTNHGFSNGHATTYQSVFQAGTAVLVNKYGYPVVRCLCGNPLTPPVSGKKYRYTGQQWPGFNQTTIIIYVAPPGNVPNVPNGTAGSQPVSPSPQKPQIGSVGGSYTFAGSNVQGFGGETTCNSKGSFAAAVTQNGNKITITIGQQAGNSVAFTLSGTIDPLGHFDLSGSASGFSVTYKGNVDATGTMSGEYRVTVGAGGCTATLTGKKS